MTLRFLSIFSSLTLAAVSLAQSTAFTYQGQLKSNGTPTSGLHDFRFRLFDAASAGTQVGTQLCADNVQVTEGTFTMPLDFGQVFVSTAPRFLEIEVRRDSGLTCGSVNEFVILSPRQLLTPAPRATTANIANALGSPNGTVPNAVIVDNSGKVGIGTATPANSLSVAGTANFAGNVGVGTTAPGVPLHIVSTSPVPAIHVASPFAVMNLQDTGTSANQTGYVSFRNQSGTETAWVGFGSAGDPDFSVVNARSGGDIVLNPFSGKVGIGTTSPSAKLEVRGDVRLGSSGQFFAAAGEENLRIVRGEVNSDGSIIRGSGFTVLRGSRGQFFVTLTTPMSDIPSVVVSHPNHAFVAVWASTSNALDSSHINVSTALNGNNEWLAFSFIAVGPR